MSEIKEYYKNGKLKLETSIKNDEKHGIQRKWYSTGQIMYEKLYENDRLVSEKWWHLNGQFYREKLYENNILIKSKEWHENGQLKREISNDGRRWGETGLRSTPSPVFVDTYTGLNWCHGFEMKWNEDGQLDFIQYYLYGKPVSKEEYKKHELIKKLSCLK